MFIIARCDKLELTSDQTSDQFQTVFLHVLVTPVIAVAVSCIPVVLTHLVGDFPRDLFGHFLGYRMTLLYRDILTDLFGKQ